jgi:hypothetical protein
MLIRSQAKHFTKIFLFEPPRIFLGKPDLTTPTVKLSNRDAERKWPHIGQLVRG